MEETIHGTVMPVLEITLQPGESIITDNLLKLHDGAPVNPHPGPAVGATAQSVTSIGSN